MHSEELLEEALQIIRSEFAEDTPLFNCLLATRGRLSFVRHKYHDAIADLSIAIRSLREFDPTDLLPAALLHAAQCHAALGDMDVAIKMAREAHSKDAAHYGDNHPETKKDLEILNSLLRRA